MVRVKLMAPSTQPQEHLIQMFDAVLLDVDFSVICTRTCAKFIPRALQLNYRRFIGGKFRTHAFKIDLDRFYFRFLG